MHHHIPMAMRTHRMPHKTLKAMMTLRSCRCEAWQHLLDQVLDCRNSKPLWMRCEALI